MIDTDKYENMRRLFLDFIDTADEDTEDAWKNNLTMLNDLLAEVERLRRVLELIGENMEYHSWMHTLIKEAIGFEKWQAKEASE
jgi:hypothetical protein